MRLADWPWIQKTLVMSLIAGLGVGIAFLLPKPYGGLILLATVSVFALGLYFNPRYRFNRAAWFVVTAWLGSKAIPDFAFVFVEPERVIGANLSQETGVLFDLSCGLCVVVLFVLDYATSSNRTPLSDLRLLFPQLKTLISNSSSEQQVVQSNSAQPIAIGVIKGEPNLTFNNFAAGGTFAAEIEMAADFLKKGQSDTSIQMLESLRKNKWDQLTDREKYRTLANLGHAYEHKEDFEKAARYYIDAHQWQPHDEQAMALNAAAYFTLGQIDTARKLVDEILNRYPFSAIGTAVRVRLSGSISASDVEATIPAQLRTHPDVLINQVAHALDREEPIKAECYARKLLSNSETTNKALEHLCAALVAKCRLARTGRIKIAENELDDNLSETINSLTTLLSDRLSCSDAGRARLRYYRAMAYRLKNEPDQAERDFIAVTEEKEVDDAILFDAAEFLASRNKLHHALGLLSRITSPRLLPFAHLLRARLLMLSNNPDDRKLAFAEIESACEMADEFPESSLFEIVDTAIDAAKYSEKDEQIDALIELQRPRLAKASYLTLLATLEFRRGNEPTARSLSFDAISELTPSPSPVLILFLARLLASLGEFDEALKILKPTVSAFGQEGLLEFAVHCAFRANDEAFILELCEGLRANGRYLQSFLETEIVTLCNVNDFVNALKVIEEGFTRINDEKFLKLLRVHRSIIGLRLDRSELVETSPDKLPASAEGSPTLGRNVAIVLANGPTPLKGAEYAYALTRRFPADPLCHRLFVLLLGMGEESLELPEFEHISVGCAVQLDLDNGKQEWKILEETDKPNPDREEISTDTSLAIMLIGKSVGSKIVLREDVIQPIEATVASICHKFIYRKMHIMANWERLFPDEFFVRSYEFKKKSDGSLDVEHFIKSFARLQAPERAYQQLLRHQPLTIGTFSKLTQTSLIESIVHLANEDDLAVVCCTGNAEEFKSAQECLDGNASVVIDATAMATLWITGVFDHIKSFPFECWVTEGSLSVFREALQNKHSRLWSKRLMHAIDDTLHIDDRLDTDIAEQKRFMKRFLNWSEATLKIESGRARLSLSNPERKRIADCVGEASMEAIAFAKERSIPIWTDDLAVAVLGEELGLKDRIWTDFVLESLKDREVLTSDLVTRFQLSLLVAGYQYTRVNLQMLEMALSESHWNPKLRPLSSVVRWIHASGVAETGALQVTIFAIQQAHESAPLVHQAQAITSETLRSIAKRPDGARLLQLLRHGADQIFGMNVFAREEFLNVIHREHAILSRGRQIILPGDPDWGI